MRKHSKFSASGAERWFNCPGSVALSEGLPETTNKWAQEGTEAHAVLEKVLESAIKGRALCLPTDEMFDHALDAQKHIIGAWARIQRDAEIMVETRISLDFIHPEAFGTFDAGIAHFFDTLHVFDYKYGKGPVSPVENLQMIFYALGLAHKYDWNFEKARLWIIQPRIRGYDGPVFWDVSTKDLRDIWVPKFEDAVLEVENNPKWYVEGGHCHWCKAKTICPLKLDEKIAAATIAFQPLEDESGQDESGQEESEEKSFEEIVEEVFNEVQKESREEKEALREIGIY